MQLAQVFVPQSLPFSANSTRLLLANDNMRFGEDKSLPPNPTLKRARALARESPRGRLAVVNVDSSSSETLSFLSDSGFRNFAGQYEMVLEL
jgi:hypothetical protein